MNKIGEYSVADDVIINLLESNNLDQSFKIELVKNIEEDRVIQNVDLAESVFDWWSDGTIVFYSFEILEAMFKSTTNFDKKIVMLLHFAERLDEEQIKSLTILIGGEFEKLFTPYQKPKFEKKTKVKSLLELLKEKDLISSITENKKTINVFPFNKKQRKY